MREKKQRYRTISEDVLTYDLSFTKQRRPATEHEAWEWLIFNVRYMPKPKKIYTKKRFVKINRGQVSASQRFLRDEWNWKSTCKVRTFLKKQVDNERIHIDTSQGQMVITLLNYEQYNYKPGDKTNGLTDGNSATITPRAIPEPDPAPHDQSQNNTLKITKDLIEYFNQCTGKKLHGWKSRAPQIRSRLKNFTVGQFKTAIENWANDSWVRENNQLHNFDAIFKTDKSVDHWLHRTPKKDKVPAETRTLLTVDEAKKHAERNRKPFKHPFYRRAGDGKIEVMYK